MPKGIYPRTSNMKTGKYKRKPFTKEHKKRLGLLHKNKPEIDRFKIGAITVRKDENGKKRNWIKVGYPYKWIQLSHYIFQKETKINPYNQIIHHKDKNPLNDDIKNLEIVTRSKHINLHRKDLMRI